MFFLLFLIERISEELFQGKVKEMHFTRDNTSINMLALG